MTLNWNVGQDGRHLGAWLGASPGGRQGWALEDRPCEGAHADSVGRPSSTLTYKIGSESRIL